MRFAPEKQIGKALCEGKTKNVFKWISLVYVVLLSLIFAIWDPENFGYIQ